MQVTRPIGGAGVAVEKNTRRTWNPRQLYESDIPVFLRHISRIWSLSGAKVMPKRPNMESQTVKVRPKVPNMEPPSAKVEPKSANMQLQSVQVGPEEPNMGSIGAQLGSHHQPKSSCGCESAVRGTKLRKPL